ncbi:MAG TPA: C69 family dipeptidase, partial [Prolixibacteraceae bacterium]|nr:C69 family dipeptidase [Prolixibacteraceae bacterium]
YAPVDFGGARFCDARIWSGFRKVTSGMDAYAQYAEGKVVYENGFAINRLPLWVKPDKALSVGDVMGLMRDHFEGTTLDMNPDAGAGPFGLPYRWRPLTWTVDSVEYCNERAISTQQTGFSFVAQSRSWLPDPIGGVLWFGVDDTYTTCYVPMYCGITKAPHPFAVGNGDMLTWSETSAFWTFNLVSNLAYLFYQPMIGDIVKVQSELEGNFFRNQAAIDQAANTLMNAQGADAARAFLTDYSSFESNRTLTRWKGLGQFLLIKYKDGNVMKEKNGVFERTETGLAPYPNQPGYPEKWKRQVANDTGDRLKVIGNAGH